MTRLHAFTLGMGLAVAGLLLSTGPTAAADLPGTPRRVLITNDNGIDDPKIAALAQAFARHSETWVVAPDSDRSGSGSYLTVFKSGGAVAEQRRLAVGVKAFAVDGYPADCVILALAGLMRESLPDLIISGINGGPNLGTDWFGSGTIGAARAAALAGIPAIAVSGLDDDLPGAVEAAVDWVVRLSATSAVRDLQPGEYLTVSLPRVTPGEILGIKVVDRAPVRVVPRFELDEDGRQWRLVGISELPSITPADSDQAAHDAGYIAVIPMQVGEVDLEHLARWRRAGVDLPEWRGAVVKKQNE